jgi:hypothetical protein
VCRADERPGTGAFGQASCHKVQRAEAHSGAGDFLGLPPRLAAGPRSGSFTGPAHPRSSPQGCCGITLARGSTGALAVTDHGSPPLRRTSSLHRGYWPGLGGASGTLALGASGTLALGAGVSPATRPEAEQDWPITPLSRPLPPAQSRGSWGAGVSPARPTEP